MFEISVAAVVPFTADHGVDMERFNTHVHRALNEGCDSATLFGTSGEGASLSGELRLNCLRDLLANGLAPEKIIYTLHASAAADAAAQANAAAQLGIRRFLLPPPCYYKQISDAGLSAWYAEVFAHSDAAASFILYNIPQVTQVEMSMEWLRSMRAEHPDRLAGVKDSRGSLDEISQLLEIEGLRVMIGDERLLAGIGPLGGAGMICGLANLGTADRMRKIAASGKEDEQLNRFVDAVVEFPGIPALKALVAHRYQDAAWRRTMPPLEELDERSCSELAGLFDSFAAG